MAFDDELTTALAELRTSLTDKALKERANAEDPAILVSERTATDVLDLARELHDVVKELWSTGKMSLVPAPVKRNLLAGIQQLGQAAQQYSQGGIRAQELENKVDSVHVILWTNALIDRVDRVAGLDAKNDRFEFLKRKGRRIIRELEKGIPKRDELTKLISAASTALQDAQASSEAAERSATTAEAHATAASTSLREARTAKEAIDTLQSQAEAAEQRARGAANNAEAVHTKAAGFYQEMEEYQQRVENAVEQAEETIASTKANATQHERKLSDLEEQVTQQLQKATGASLFHAFHERKEAISVAKWVWALLSVGSLAFAVWWGVYLARTAGSVESELFWIKISATVPLLALVVFALAQYGRERRTEEEYAFKSALSLSLVPYKDLIEKLHADGHNPDYTQFLVKTIGQIYAAPLVTEDRPDNDTMPLAGIREITKMLEKVVDR